MITLIHPGNNIYKKAGIISGIKRSKQYKSLETEEEKERYLNECLTNLTNVKNVQTSFNEINDVKNVQQGIFVSNEKLTDIDKELSMIDYIASEGYLQGKTLEIANNLKQAFRQQKSLSCSFDYEKLFVDGGKQDPQWEKIFQANRKWNEFESFLKHQAKFVEKMMCIEKTIGEYKKELGELGLMENVSKLIMIIEKLARILSSDWDLLVVELKNKVYSFGFRKTCRETRINQSTLKKIINGDKNINFKSLERLVKFFELDKITR